MLLITTPHLASPDDFYEALIDAHRGLDTASSHELNAKLVLLLSNHIGDEAVLREAFDTARASVARSEPQVAADIATKQDRRNPTP